MGRWHWLAFGALVAASGCDGFIGRPGGATRGNQATPTSFHCEPDADPGATELHRLSKRQYRLTMLALVSKIPSGSTQERLRQALAQGLDRVPDDDHDRQDAVTTAAHVRSYFEVARTFAETALADEEGQRSLLGECAVDGDRANDAVCIQEFVARFGMWTTRRPLPTDELSYYRQTVYGDGHGASLVDMQAFKDVIVVMLSSPQFVHHVRMEGTPVQGRDDLLELTPYELAARLSYHFWDSMPDDELLAAAADGSLQTRDGYRAQVERLYADPRTDATFDAFFADWLELERVGDPSLNVGDPVFDAMAGSMRPSADFRAAAIRDVLSLTRDVRQRGRFADLFRSRASFADTEELAGVYGAPVWTGEGNPPELPPERSGVLTRVATLMNDGPYTRPVMKGLRVRRSMLCDELGQPPENATTKTVQLEPPFSNRDELEALTMQPGSECVGCHHLINPIGYALDGFDALGRARTHEPRFDDNGTTIATLPVITEGVPQIDDGDDAMVDSARDLSERLAESDKARACFARQYHRFTFQRSENIRDDACALESVRQSLGSGSLGEALRDVAFSRAFKLHKRGAQ